MGFSFVVFLSRALDNDLDSFRELPNFSGSKETGRQENRMKGLMALFNVAGSKESKLYRIGQEGTRLGKKVYADSVEGREF